MTQTLLFDKQNHLNYLFRFYPMYKYPILFPPIHNILYADNYNIKYYFLPYITSLQRLNKTKMLQQKPLALIKEQTVTTLFLNPFH